MKLSIIIPVYNVASYLRKCVDSLLAQDYADREIILVDDGSTDGSGDICDEYASRSSIIKVIHQPNGGLSAARNSGLAIAQGDYICFVDSDDYWQPNMLGALMAQIERDNLDVLRFRLQYVRIVESGKSRVEREYKIYNPYKSDPFVGNDYAETVTDGLAFLNTRMNTQCYAWTFILRRELMDDCLFTEGIYFEDTDWTPRMLVKAQRVASTDRVVYNYLLTRQGSITNAPNRAKLQKVLDDKMRLVGELQRQAALVCAGDHDDAWFSRMTASLVVSIIDLLSTDFYTERKSYLERLRALQIFPLPMDNYKSQMKLWLINFYPNLMIELLHIKNSRKI